MNAVTLYDEVKSLVRRYGVSALLRATASYYRREMVPMLKTEKAIQVSTALDKAALDVTEVAGGE